MADKKKNKIVLMKGEATFHYIALVIMTLFMLFCIGYGFSYLLNLLERAQY